MILFFLTLDVNFCIKKTYNSIELAERLVETHITLPAKLNSWACKIIVGMQKSSWIKIYGFLIW